MRTLRWFAVTFCSLILVLLSFKSRAQIPCSTDLYQVNYEADTLPEDDPIAPWTRSSVGVTNVYVDNGVLVMESGQNSFVIYGREEDIQESSAYSMEARVWFSNLFIPPTQSTAAFGIEDGEKSARIFFQDGIRHSIVMDLKTGERLEHEIDWEQPHTYRIDVIRNQHMHVFVDEQLVFGPIPYENLFDSTYGNGGLHLSTFHGAESSSYWDYVRYELCETFGPPPIEDQIVELKNEIDRMVDAPNGLKNKLKNELDKIINIEDPHEQGLKLLWISERLFQARFSGAAKTGTERVATRLDFARDTVAPGISRYDGYRGYLKIISVEPVSNVVKPGIESARYAVTIELDPISRHINNQRGSMFGFFLQAGGIDIATGEIIGIQQTFYELPMQLDRLNNGEVYTIGPLYVTYDGLTEDLLPVEPGRSLFIGGTIEYAEVSRDNFNVITHIDSSSFTTWDGESERGEMVPRIRDRQPETELVWDRYVSDPAIARNSFAAAHTGCSGIMLGPNIYATASHCGRALLVNPWIEFITYKGSAAVPAARETETFFCDYIVDTENDTDLELFYCHPNAGVNPGDKYGYAEPTLTRPEFGDQVYSIWRNPISSEGRNDALLYSEGEITGWHSFPEGYAHASVRPNVPLCMSNTCIRTPPFADYNQDDQVRTAMDTNVWGYGGASGSVHFDSETHRMVLGPTTSADKTFPNGGPGRGALNWFDWMVYGWIPDANVLGTFQYPGDPTPTQVIVGNNDKICFGCYGTATAPATNDTFLQSQFGLNGAAYRGRDLDEPRNMVIDVQEDIERIQGESNRDYYFPWFGSARWNAQWEYFGWIAYFDAYERLRIWNVENHSDTTGVTLRTIPIDTGTPYLIRFDTDFTSHAENTVLYFIVRNGGGSAYRVDPHSGWQRNAFVANSLPANGWLAFELFGEGDVFITQFVIMEDGAHFDFDNVDVRRRWEYVSDSSPAPILPLGNRGVGTVGSDWAGLVTREIRDSSFNTRHYGIVFVPGRRHQVCFQHMQHERPGQGNFGEILIRDDDNDIDIHVQRFWPTRNWQQECIQFSVPNNAEWVQMKFNTAPGIAYFVDDITVTLLP